MQLETTRSKILLAALVVGFSLTGCASETWQWDWDWWKEGNNRNQRTTAAKPRRPAGDTRTAQTTPRPAKTPANPQDRQVEAKVEQYVRAMESRSDTQYTPNDFNAKIRRQEDPRRPKRIRRIADQTRAEPTPVDRPVRPGADRPVENQATRSPAATPLQDPVQEPAVRAAAVAPAISGDTAAAGRSADQPAQPDPSPGEVAEPRMDSEWKRITPRVDTPERQVTPPEPATNATEPPAQLPVDEPTGAGDREPAVLANTATPEAPDPAIPASEPGDSPQTPPVLEEIKITAAPDAPPEAASESPTLRPEANTAKAPIALIDTFKQRVLTLAARIEKDPDNLEDRLSLALLHLGDGRDDDALAAIDGADAEVQGMVRAYVEALIAAKSSPGRDPAVRANDQLEKLEELRDLIRTRADLQVPVVVLCTAIDGFGRYTPFETQEFPAGRKNKVLLYIEVDNFRSDKTPGGMYRTLLSVRQSLLAAKTGEELWSAHDANIEDLARQRRRDFYLTVGPVVIPGTLAAGEYVLKVEVEDRLAGKINSNVARFKLTP